jgi:zinc transport system substrate-binding protein
VQALRIATIALALAVAGCGGSNAASSGRTIVAAFYPLAFAAEEIGGPTVSVRNLTATGVEPHDVELSVRDVQRIQQADLVLYLGAGFQPAVERAVGDAKGTTADLLEGMHLRAPEEPDDHAAEEPEHQETSDPHVWLDPVRYAQIARRIGKELDRRLQGDAFAERLEALDREFSRGLADCSRREFVTSHAAFAYLAGRYRLEQVPIAGVSPEAEPTPRELEEIIEHVREVGATTIFFETLVSPRVAETVARETGARTRVLNPIEGLTADDVERGADYFSLMRANLAELRKALGCR